MTAHPKKSDCSGRIVGLGRCFEQCSSPPQRLGELFGAHKWLDLGEPNAINRPTGWFWGERKCLVSYWVSFLVWGFACLAWAYGRNTDCATKQPTWDPAWELKAP